MDTIQGINPQMIANNIDPSVPVHPDRSLKMKSSSGVSVNGNLPSKWESLIRSSTKSSTVSAHSLLKRLSC